MSDIENPRLLYGKAIIFVLTGIIASLLLLIEMPTLKNTILLAVAIWAFARAYYFAFYVIERYIDPTFRFAGLISLLRYLAGRRQRPAAAEGKRREDQWQRYCAQHR